MFDLDAARAERRHENDDAEYATETPFVFRLNGREWTCTSSSLIDLKLLADVNPDTPAGIMAVLKEMLGPKQWAEFPRITSAPAGLGTVMISDVVEVCTMWLAPAGGITLGE